MDDPMEGPTNIWFENVPIKGPSTIQRGSRSKKRNEKSLQVEAQTIQPKITSKKHVSVKAASTIQRESISKKRLVKSLQVEPPIVELISESDKEKRHISKVQVVKLVVE
ncbi:hypothetical protein L1887_11251 [Cichorium endivia]|nr:hypothetical protein L1887_11251 [Cichorium endivia]